jgi:hypothetical protein
MTEDDYMPEFDGATITEQLGKILDSRGNKIIRDWVKLEDGKVVKGISFRKADRIREAIFNTHPSERLELIRYATESSTGFKEVMKAVG